VNHRLAKIDTNRMNLHVDDLSLNLRNTMPNLTAMGLEGNIYHRAKGNKVSHREEVTHAPI